MCIGIRNGTIVMMFIWVSILFGKDVVPAGLLQQYFMWVVNGGSSWRSQSVLIQYVCASERKYL